MALVEKFDRPAAMMDDYEPSFLNAEHSTGVSK